MKMSRMKLKLETHRGKKHYPEGPKLEMTNSIDHVVKIIIQMGVSFISLKKTKKKLEQKVFM